MDHPSQASPLTLASLLQLTTQELRALWPQWFDQPPAARLRHGLLLRMLAYRIQERQQGGLSATTRKQLRTLADVGKDTSRAPMVDTPRLRPGTHVIREWGNEMHQVTVEAKGFVYRGQRYRSLSEIARRITGTRWSGPVFFGVKSAVRREGSRRKAQA